MSFKNLFFHGSRQEDGTPKRETRKIQIRAEFFIRAVSPPADTASVRNKVKLIITAVSKSVISQIHRLRVAFPVLVTTRTTNESLIINDVEAARVLDNSFLTRKYKGEMTVSQWKFEKLAALRELYTHTHTYTYVFFALQLVSTTWPPLYRANTYARS